MIYLDFSPLWSIILPVVLFVFRLKSAILASRIVTTVAYEIARRHPDCHYHVQYLHGYRHPVSLYLMYEGTDKVFSLHPRYHLLHTVTRLLPGQWFRIHSGDIRKKEHQIGYAVLNRIVQWQQTKVVVEVVAAVAEWKRAEYIWVAIPYRNVHPAYRPLPPSSSTGPFFWPDDCKIPVPPSYSFPEDLYVEPLVTKDWEQLPRLPQLPSHSRSSSSSTIASYESLIDDTPHPRIPRKKSVSLSASTSGDPLLPTYPPPSLAAW